MKRSGLNRLEWTISLIAAAALLPSAAIAGNFAVMSYNVRGLPALVIEDRTAEIAAIAPLLEDFHKPDGSHAGIDSLVLLQELFDQGYYNTLTSPMTVSYPHKTPKDTGGPNGIGDGLNMLSDFGFTGFGRTKWDDCFGTQGSAGSDCDTNKGFSFARVEVGPGVTIDVYNLHADAGQDEGSRAARRSNITQLAEAIQAGSPEGTPVIVMGDTNSRYRRSPNDNIETLLGATGLKDVWVELLRGGVVPGPGADIDSGCDTHPGGADCELVDKIFYRSGSNLTLVATQYAVLSELFSDGEGNDLSDHFPVTARFEYTVALGTSTTSSTSTSSTSSSTTTTQPVEVICGDANGNGVVQASDALFVLKVAVGTEQCALCVCDVDSSGSTTAADSLRVLKKAVGQAIELTCVPC